VDILAGPVHNLETIAESKFEPHFHLRAVCYDEWVVGMLAYCHETDPEDFELFWIFRLMIDKSFQGRGFGFAAMQLAMDEMKELGATRIRTMHRPGNAVAASLYAKLGFQLTGEALDDGDLVLERGLRQGTGHDAMGR